MTNSLKVPKNITFESINKNIYLLNINNGEYYELSESASIIWNEIAKGKDIKDIKLNIKSMFENNERIEDDIDEIIESLKDIGLLKDH